MAHGRLSLFGVGGWDRRSHPAQSQRSESVAVRLFRGGRRSSGTLMAASCTRTAIYAACRSYPLWLTMSLASPREDEREPAALLYDTLLLDHRFST